MSLSRQQITLIGIFTIFLGPVILVMLMRSSWWQYQPDGLKNFGHLVQPPVPLSLNIPADIDRRWIILYVLDQPCEQKCIKQVNSLRQIHKAAGRNREKLAVVLLSKTRPGSAQRATLETVYPEFRLATDDKATALATLQAVNNSVAINSGQSSAIRTYILDPVLNVILAYGVDANPNDIHKDLKQLLK
jgi:hypothetical protein